MVVALVVVVVVAVAIGAVLLVTQADLRATRSTAAEHEARTMELSAEVADWRTRVSAAEAERDARGAAASAADKRAADAGRELERTRVARSEVEEQLRRVRAERDELDRRNRMGDDRLAVALWGLELARSDREWQVLSGPVPEAADADAAAAGGLAQAAPGAALADALRRQLDRFREEIGVPTDFSGSVDRPLPASLAVLGLRATEELVAAAARHCEGVAVEIGVAGDRLAIVTHCDRLEGGADRLPLGTLRDALTNRGGTLDVASDDAAAVVSVAVSLPLP